MRDGGVVDVGVGVGEFDVVEERDDFVRRGRRRGDGGTRGMVCEVVCIGIVFVVCDVCDVEDDVGDEMELLGGGVECVYDVVEIYSVVFLYSEV